ncbi:PDZ domain-containing protein [Spirosoma sp. BT702]|uniref:PDZ domain-containing protein n=1 Tax=Spirosoma profusum TaxID=2771354 RepID=A0A927ATA8_9BACT|nr:S41 family peptidase [Spirosoma profusum]MBD2703035.1 PDZ domain-containing protein [Spirosoma profusum]
MRKTVNRLLSVRSSLLLALVGATLSLASCQKPTDEVAPQTTTGSTSTSATASENQTINDWILSNMQELYYWNDKIPANPDKTQAPDVFFESLLNKYDATTNPNGDRFSWIQESADELAASLSGQTTTTGMEYNLFLRSSGGTGVIAQVLYVLPGSPAEKAGLKRGDIISKVNGQLLSTTNYANLLFSGSTYTFGLASLSGQSLVDSDQTRTVTATVFQENPVFLDSVYTVGNKKIGYLVYNQFVPGANGSNASEYDAQVDAIFSDFKAKGVNELVLDLRYNPGGYTSSSANLASLIGKGVSSSKLYFREEWNATLTPQLQKEYGSSFFAQNFVTKAQNIGANLSRVFVLTTDQTASASELIINGLRPYMTVTTIGTTTYGKNVGSITVTDESGKIKWGMQPIVFKSYNSLGQSDYSTGFKPSIEVEEPLTLLPLGDTNEAMLRTAFNQISGAATSGRQGVTANPLSSVGSSIQRKAGGHAMVRALKSLNL